MRSIATVQFKGGTGKSNCVVHLAVAAVLVGYRAAILDTDSQTSIMTWARNRAHPLPTVIAIEPERVAEWLASHGQSFDLCFVDTPAHDWEALACAAAAVDFSLIVSRPTVFDLDVAIRVRDVLRRYNLAHATLLSQIPPRVSRRVELWLATYSDLSDIVDTPISALVAYQDSIALGVGVKEYQPDSRAAGEIDQILAWILRRLEQKR